MQEMHAKTHTFPSPKDFTKFFLKNQLFFAYRLNKIDRKFVEFT